MRPMPRRKLDDFVRSQLGNPYGEQAVTPPAPSVIERALRELRHAEGDFLNDLTLAIAHAQALSATHPAAILGEAHLPRGVLRRLRHSRGDYIRVAAAAVRCRTVLDGIRGSSVALRQVRSATWAACFGHSLRHALELGQVIHDHDVLILGETGTGKELFALAVQQAVLGDSQGNAPPRSAINAAAIPDTLVESELFGHVKGAFTGAGESRVGRLRSADGGSLFLDEVGDLPSTTQVKLLRVIESNEVYPVGSDTPHHVELRYVAATHKNLEEMVSRGEFRGDLFERLAGKVLRIPPLRERPDDILDIGRAFVARYVPGSDRDQTAAIERWLRSSEARSHNWPGNVRELQNALRNLLLGLPPGLRTDAPPEVTKADAVPVQLAEFELPLSEALRWYARGALDRCDGNVSLAARRLGVDRATLKRRIS